MELLTYIIPRYLLFLALTLGIILGAHRLSRRLFPGESIPSRIALTLFLAIAYVHVIIVSLGILGQVWLIWYALATLVFMAGGLWLGRGRTGDQNREFKLTGFELVVVVLVLGWFAWFAVTGLLFPPTGVDDLEYHLPFTAQALQTGRLEPFFTPYTGPIYYPQVIEAGYLWLLLPLHDDFLINLGNLPFHALLILGARQILREWGVSRNFSALAMPLLLFSKIVSKQAWVAHVDVPLAALFLFAGLALVRYERRGKRADLVLFGLALGLLLSTKYSALGYGALLMFALFGQELLQRRGIAAAVKSALIAAALMLMVGGWWRLRNLMVTGTPLYPAGVSFGGVTIFPEGSFFFVKNLSRTSLFYTLLDRPLAIERLANGLATGVMFWLVIALPSSLLAPLDRRVRHFPSRPAVPMSVYILWGVTALTLLLYLNTPYAGSWSPSSDRSLGELLTHRIRNPLAMPMTNSSELDVIYRGVRHGISCWALALIGSIFWFDRRWSWPDGPGARIPGRLRSRRVPAALVIVLATAPIYLYSNRFDNYYQRVNRSVKPWAPCWEWIEENAPAGSRIAFTQMYLPYYDFGRRFDKTPAFVSVNQVNGDNYHEFEGQGLRGIHQQPAFEHWLKNLREKGVDFVHWGRRDKDRENVIEHSWLKAHPELFRPVFARPACKVYQLESGP